MRPNIIATLHAVGRVVLRLIWFCAEIFRGVATYLQRGKNSTNWWLADSTLEPACGPPLPKGEGRGEGEHSVQQPVRPRIESLVRGEWLYHICRRLVRVLGVQITIAETGERRYFSGNIPTRGLVVVNHLSYVDVVLLGALTPCVFVAKSEVKAWPIFGWFARMAGTIFVNRNSRRDVARANEEIRAALRDGALVVLFAEGTSSDGSTVLPFKSSLLEAAIGERVPITVAAIQYHLADGNARTDVCYWGKHTLAPHLLNLMSKQAVQASLAFSEVTNTWRDRKKLAAQLHDRISSLHSELRRASSAVEPTKFIPTSHRYDYGTPRVFSPRQLHWM